jgi:threonine dehydrogenase-like Zn-dependent dehydrogenase
MSQRSVSTEVLNSHDEPAGYPKPSDSWASGPARTGGQVGPPATPRGPAAARLMQAIRATRPGGHVGYVGVAHDVSLPGEELFFSEVHLLGGPAPVRRFLPELITMIGNREIDPGKVFDLTLPLDDAAEAYRAMDERRAIKALLRP